MQVISRSTLNHFANILVIIAGVAATVIIYKQRKMRRLYDEREDGARNFARTAKDNPIFVESRRVFHESPIYEPENDFTFY